MGAPIDIYLIHIFRLTTQATYCVGKWSFHCVQIVSTDGYQCSPAADILMQLILQIDEAIITFLRELNIVEDSSHHKRPNELQHEHWQIKCWYQESRVPLWSL